MRIYIIGFMGCGKSTYGKALAQAMNLNFIDLDEEIVNKSGKGISQIFEDEGELAFREMETAILQETKALEKTVIATGGGTACFGDNMQWMNENGKTVYLKLFETELYDRLEEDQLERPLLKDIPEDELLTFIYSTLRKRAFYYHQAQIVLDPEEIKAEELAKILVEDN